MAKVELRRALPAQLAATTGISGWIWFAAAPEYPAKNVSGAIGNSTLTSLPGYRALAMPTARSMLSAQTTALKLAPPLLTTTEILIISRPHFLLTQLISVGGSTHLRV